MSRDQKENYHQSAAHPLNKEFTFNTESNLMEHPSLRTELKKIFLRPQSPNSKTVEYAYRSNTDPSKLQIG